MTGLYRIIVRRIFAFLFIVFVSSAAYGQETGLVKGKKARFSGLYHMYYYRGPLTMTAGGGIALYRGNLCGRPECNNLQPVLNGGMHYKLWPHISLGGEVSYFRLSAFAYFLERNIFFKSSNLEAKFLGRYYFFQDKLSAARNRIQNRIKLNLYLTTGLSFLYFSPETSYRYFGEKKGSGLERSTGLTVGVPVGGGLLYNVSSRINIVGEVLYTSTFSDRLENLKSLQNPFLLDSYAFMLIKLEYMFE